jgi:hypothetical protein
LKIDEPLGDTGGDRTADSLALEGSGSTPTVFSAGMAKLLFID